MSESGELLRRLPSVDRLLQTEPFQALAARHGRALTLETARAALAQARTLILDGDPKVVVWAADSTEEALIAQLGLLATEWLAMHMAPTLQAVINATGVILHTNMGRAPLSAQVLQAMTMAGEGYSNLEYDLAQGQRGSRYAHAEELLCRLTGAEAAVLVNNNAGAVLLMLTALARDKGVVVSRGQLVEIGGGFRIPDVMRQSGAMLVEVGATNRTYVEDYVQATDADTVAYLRVHASNFAQTGFVHQPPLADLVAAAHARGLLVLDDLGSGTLLDTAPYGLAHEPTVQESVAAGADVVTFSGDKLLGGPQAGVIVGRQDLIAAVRRHPLIRALRVDKTTIAGIQANLLHYVRGEAETHIPVWRMIAMPLDEIQARAMEMRAELRGVGLPAELLDGRSMVGGGSLPEQSLPTCLLALATDAPDRLAAHLRRAQRPAVVRVQDDQIVLDLRTVLPGQDAVLTQQLLAAWRGMASSEA
jgi:L-seryl-tRNA(Ser) seleniumtransferase